MYKYQYMREQILQLVSEKPKHFSKIIKNNNDLYNWVLKNTLVQSLNLSEMIYSALYQVTNVCANNNIKKFGSISTGYKFCGKASSCKCAKQSVAEKVSVSKNNYSESKKVEINEKRKNTTMSRYGVSNNAQTAQAKEKHTLFYQNSDNVANVVKQIAQTKQQRYNNPTYNNSLQIKQTFKKKADNGYWKSVFPDKDIETLLDKETLVELYNTTPVWQIAEKLGVHIQTVYKHLNSHNIREPFKSSEENEIVRFLQSEGITNIVRNTRKLLPSKKEIDIYLPDYNLAIEYNGVYWHHEDIAHITRSYHLEKFKECEAIGVQLITIFSNFWKTKPEIVKHIIRSKLKLQTKAIYARQCNIVDVDTATSRLFLNKYHIQGYTTASIRYGLEHNNKLVALMTFGKSRTGIGKKEDTHELIRFASIGRVVGAASKLLSHFVKSNNFNKIVSYSDNEWSNGSLYQKLGFTLESEIPPSYWYLNPKEEKLYHRYNFAKYKLVEQGFNSSKTEKQITKEIGLLKVWDCGKKRWVYPNAQKILPFGGKDG